MKLISIFLMASFGVYAVESVADCTAPKLTNAQISTAFTGSIVCAVPGPDAASVGADGPWHERHNSDGSIDEMHSNTPADPIETGIASWNVTSASNGDGVISYTYTGGTNISYTIKDNGGSYSFCKSDTNAEIANATLNSCP